MSTCTHCNNNEAMVVLQKDGEQLEFCPFCYNTFMSQELGTQNEIETDSFMIVDSNNVNIEFEVNHLIHPMGHRLEASERKENGYKFAVHGELDCDQNKLLDKLVEKVKRGIRVTYIKEDSFPDGQRFKTIPDDRVIGNIEYDADSRSTPLVVIDGKPYKWEELGEMLTTYEGFQFDLKIYDDTDDIE